MNLQIDQFSRSLDLSKKLLNQTLSGMEELISLRLDRTQELIGRSSQQLKSAMSDPIILDAPAKWSDAMYQGIHSAINLARDTALASTDYQIETLQVLQNQASEVQKVISAAISEQLKSAESTASSGKRGNKPAAPVQELAA
jgi:hypothetical protein